MDDDDDFFDAEMNDFAKGLEGRSFSSRGKMTRNISAVIEQRGEFAFQKPMVRDGVEAYIFKAS